MTKYSIQFDVDNLKLSLVFACTDQGTFLELVRSHWDL
jgi:hypothetical protein